MSASRSHRHDGNDFVNRWVFRCRRNDDRVDAAVTVGGRLFQVLVPAAEKDRSPSVSTVDFIGAKHDDGCGDNSQLEL